jgi:hypothetical protein
MRGLQWLARVGPSPLDPWRYAMGWSEVAARSHARRLEQFGWLERCAMVRGQGALFMATRRGVQMLGLPIPAASSPAPTWWAHDCACAWVAALLTIRAQSFLGPRELLTSKKWFGQIEWMDRHSYKASGHRPDLVADGSKGAVCCEVELAAKSRPRLDAILRVHEGWLITGQSSFVDYVCGDEQGVRRIQAAADRAAPDLIERGRLCIYLLDSIKAAAIEEFEAVRARTSPGHEGAVAS